jgi:hypothetical protein
MAVELALELRIDQRDCRGAAGGCRLQRQHRRTSPSQVLVRGVDDDIGIGRIMNRGDLTVAEGSAYWAMGNEPRTESLE